MKIHYLNSILALVIGFSTIISGAENSPIQPTEQIQAAPVGVTPVTVDLQHTMIATDSQLAQPVVTIATPDGQQTPMLIGFDLDLYKEYCDARVDTFNQTYNEKLKTVLGGSFIAFMGVLAIREIGIWKLPAFVSKALSTFWQHSLYEKTWDVWGMRDKVLMGFVAATGLYTATTLSQFSDNAELWENRASLLAQEKQALWHQIIYQRLGKPKVIGARPMTVPYKLKGVRNGVEVLFDPFNREHVKALLGFNPNDTCWHFEKIEIIVA